MCAGASAFPTLDSDLLYNGYPEEAEVTDRLWKPLVLLIPLRLGLTDINEAYIETLKVGDLGMRFLKLCIVEVSWELGVLLPEVLLPILDKSGLKLVEG